MQIDLDAAMAAATAVKEGANMAEYQAEKAKIVRQVQKCVNNFENNFSGCLLDGVEQFKKLADIEYQNLLKKEKDSNQRQNIREVRQAFIQNIKSCEQYENLSSGVWLIQDTFYLSAECQLRNAQHYYFYFKGNTKLLPPNWTINQTIESLFLSY